MSFSKSMAIRRKEKDIFKLRSAGHKVLETEQHSTWNIEFCGTPTLMQALRTRLTRRASG